MYKLLIFSLKVLLFLSLCLFFTGNLFSLLIFTVLGSCVVRFFLYYVSGRGWVSFLIFVLFLGGMLVLYTYFLSTISITGNENFLRVKSYVYFTIFVLSMLMLNVRQTGLNLNEHYFGLTCVSVEWSWVYIFLFIFLFLLFVYILVFLQQDRKQQHFL